MDILVVFFSEFHDEKGPILLYQYPEGVIDKKEYTLLSDYIIPKPVMCDKIFKMRKDNYILMGMPIEILNKKYKRKAIEFNLGFFLTEQAGSTKSERQKDIEVYSKILK